MNAPYWEVFNYKTGEVIAAFTTEAGARNYVTNWGEYVHFWDECNWLDFAKMYGPGLSEYGPV